MGDSVAQVQEGGQQPVDDHQPIRGAGADRPLTRPIGQSCVPTCLPARPELGDQIGEHFSG